MNDEKLRERISREFEQEAYDLEKHLRERRAADPELAAMKMPDDSFDDLMRRIAAEQKETEPGSVKNEDTASPKKPFHIRKRVLLAVAAAAVLAVAMGVGATGAKLFVPKVENSSKDGEFNTTINNGDIEEKKDITEEEAYQEIEDKIGIQALRVSDKPDGMKLEKVYIDENMGEAQMEFGLGKHTIVIYENKQMDNATFDKNIDGKIVDVIETFYLEEKVEITKIDKENNDYSYSVQIEHGNAYYYVNSDLELDEFEKIIMGIIFKSV